MYSLEMSVLCRTVPAWTLLIACLPLAAQAQVLRTGMVRGMVIDASDQPLSDVLIFIDGGVNPVVTGNIGAFRLDVAASGTYVLNFRKAGYEPRSFVLPATQNDGDLRDVGVIRLEPGPELGGTFTGRITEAIGGRPVRGALVEVNGNTVAVSGADGSFTTTIPVAWGPNQLQVRHLSYAEATDNIWVINPDDVYAFDVVLVPIPVAVVPEIVVEVDRELRVYGRMRAFYERRNIGAGDFFTRREIEERNPNRVSDMLYGIPGVTLTPLGISGVQISFDRSTQGLSGQCQSPAIYIDGAFAQGGLYLDQLVSPEQVEAIELYQGVVETPPQFMRGGNPCGVIVIWTR